MIIPLFMLLIHSLERLIEIYDIVPSRQFLSVMKWKYVFITQSDIGYEVTDVLIMVW